jgi:transposase
MDDLFDGHIPLLPWLPDETLFSLCSRLHKLWGSTRAGRTAEILFGSGRTGCHHDFPSGIEFFSRCTGERLGSIEYVAGERTLLRYYRPFISSDDWRAAVSAMSGRSVAHLKYRLGLLTSRFRANHPLKACASCMAEDVESTGWAYWHLPHQFPGMWVCPIHGQALYVSTVKSTGVERFLWHLPQSERLMPAVATPPDVMRALTSLAQTVVDLVLRSVEAGMLAIRLSQPFLLRRAGELGWVTDGGHLRMALAAKSYLEYCAPLRGIPELSALPSTHAQSVAQLGPLLRGDLSRTHPLRILLAIDWLFGGATQFHDATRLGDGHAAQSPGPAKRGCVKNPATSKQRAQVLALVAAGSSATAAAAQAGVAVATAMAWLASAGVRVPRRPKLLDAKVRARLIKSLRAGMDKAKAAEGYGISQVTVTCVLRTEVGLQSAWHQARYEAAQRAARRSWLNAARRFPGLGTKQLRDLVPGSYAWLYRNDRVWLSEHVPPKLTRAPASVRLQWDQRDEQLSTQVRRLVMQLQLANGARPVRLWQLYQAIPELKAKLAQLDRLPLTKRVIEEARARRNFSNRDRLFDGP